MEYKSLFPDFENTATLKNEIELYIYVDEIKKLKNLSNEFWMYIGLLLIEAENKPQNLKYLLKQREKLGYYDELHFRDLTNYSYANIYSEKTKLAKSWIELVLSVYKPRNICFHILGLNLDNLEYRAFGRRQERMRNIYNRFFRSTILYCLKSYFGKYKNIVVKQIFHDKGNLDKDELFDWHTIWRIETEEEKISFSDENIRFIDSDHNKENDFPEESHFIQLTDLVLGATSQCLDATNNRDGCNEIAQIFLPLVDRLNDERRVNNPQSRYDYFRKCGLSFFPKRRLTLDQLEDRWERVRSGFYRNREIILKEKLSGQRNIFRYPFAP